MKAVLDTNVLLSALTKREGLVSERVHVWMSRHTLVASPPLLAEVENKLVEKFGFPIERSRYARSLLEQHFTMVTPVKLDRAVCRDPDDDMVLGTAWAAEADCIVTGDQDLLVLEQFQGIRILSPKTFEQLDAA